MNKTNIEWYICHPGSGEPMKVESFEIAMDKWFEGFNLPHKYTNGICESVDESYKRVKEYFESQKV
jgi:hypothetical protein